MRKCVLLILFPLIVLYGDNNVIVSSEELLMKCELTSRNINCNDQNLSEIPKTDQLRSETRMDLSYNNLESIPNGSFKNYSSLEYLNLRFCEIKAIEVYAFQELRSIKKVDLSYNNIKSLDSNTFITNTILETVLLASNHLQTNVSKQFLYSQSIKTLDLSSCNLRSLSRYFFSTLPELKSLNISNNFLNELPHNVFQFQVNLTEVKVHNNIWQCSEDNKQLMCSIENVRIEGNWICYNEGRRKETINLNEICGHYIPTTLQESVTTTSLQQVQSDINQSSHSTDGYTQEVESVQTTSSVPATASITIKNHKSVTEGETPTTPRKIQQAREEIDFRASVPSNNNVPETSAQRFYLSIWQFVLIVFGVYIVSFAFNIPCSFWFIKNYRKRSDVATNTEVVNPDNLEPNTSPGQDHPSGSDSVPQTTQDPSSSTNMPHSSSEDEVQERLPLLEEETLAMKTLRETKDNDLND